MLHLLALLLTAVAPASALPPNIVVGTDPRPGPMPMENKMLLPARAPECADKYQAQRAAEERIKGYEPECLPPVKTDRKSRGN